MELLHLAGSISLVALLGNIPVGNEVRQLKFENF